MHLTYEIENTQHDLAIR